jgi:hypothetical protein
LPAELFPRFFQEVGGGRPGGTMVLESAPDLPI